MKADFINQIFVIVGNQYSGQSSGQDGSVDWGDRRWGSSPQNAKACHPLRATIPFILQGLCIGVKVTGN